MEVDNEYLQCLGVGLQGLRTSGQFCDAMVCVGSTRILVHKVVLSAASKTLHELALDFDMMPHRDRDQLEIVIPPDISLLAVNAFINFIYTGQLDLSSRIVGHMERLASLFGIQRLTNICQKFIQRSTTPDSQNLNLQTVNQTEADSSLNGSRPGRREHRLSSASELSRSNSACSGFSSDLGSSGVVNVKIEPAHLAAFETAAGPAVKGMSASSGSTATTVKVPGHGSLSMLEKLMSPRVNLQKLPANITPDVVVMVSDDETEGVGNSPPHSGVQYTLEEKEAIAVEAKRYGTTQVAKSRNIPLQDILSWMTVFGLRNPGALKKDGRGKQVNHEADLALVRWIVQQQELHGCVDLDSMKQYALTVHQKTNPKFCASKTWLGNFLQRNLSVLQKTKFVHGDKMEMNLCVKATLPAGKSVKQEWSDGDEQEHNLFNNLSDGLVLEQANLSELGIINEALSGTGHLSNDIDDVTDGDDCMDSSELYGDNSGCLASSYLMDEEEENQPVTEGPQTQGSVVTPFGKRPIIVGQSKSFDMKSERKIVQWVLERNARDGYVFTDDFKDFAKSLYKGSKPFGATQCWMKKFLRRNRVLNDVKFCSKYKNTYTTGEKQTAVALAKRFGVGYASKRTGINQKIIHCWKLSTDKGLLTLESVDTDNLVPSSLSVVSESPYVSLQDSQMDIPQCSTPAGHEMSASNSSRSEASHGIVPEFENRIVAEIKKLQLKEGSVNYNDISAISQSIYKETRPAFKASYGWIKTFLERRKNDLLGIELENVSKILIENEIVPSSNEISKEQVTAMVDQALKAIGTEDIGQTGEQVRRPIIVGPSVMFDRKTEKHLVDWALEKFNKDGYVFTDDFKQYAKSVHKGPKHFSASSGWMTLFLRRHRALKDVQWKSKFKNNYTEEEKMAAVQEAKRLGTGHVGRKLGIDPALICAWRIKMERNAPKHQTFWKGTKLKKFGWKYTPKFRPVANPQVSEGSSEAFRGVVPEFEQKIIDLIHEEHEKEGSISYEEMSRLAQSVYKETRPSFKASYAWIRNFMKRNEGKLQELNIENVKKVFMPDDENNTESNSDPASSFQHDPDNEDFQLTKVFHKRPIIIGQSRAFDTKTEKRLVQWLVDQQEKNGYVFLDQFKTFAQSLYKGQKKFAATQAWRIKFLRRNHAALKHVKFTSRFRNQYSLKEKKVIVQESKKYGVAHVAKITGIEHTLINQWRLKLERSGLIPADESEPTLVSVPSNSLKGPGAQDQPLTAIKKRADPGLFSSRGIVPAMEHKIIQMINNKMDDEGSVSYKYVSLAARSVYKETRPQFKASYNWVMDFIKRNKKALRHVNFEPSRKADFGNQEIDMEILVSEDSIPNMEELFAESHEASQAASGHVDMDDSAQSWGDQEPAQTDSHSASDPMIVIENFEGEVLRSQEIGTVPEANAELNKIAQSKRPIIIGKAKHFTRKEEKQIVEWLLEKNKNDGFVFTDDFRRYARSMYKGEKEKFGATNAWITKFLRRNRLENRITFQSKLVGNNPKFEEKIIQLILEQQQKEGSVSNDDIQRLTMSVYKEIRPNFRACYNWIKDFIKRHKDELAGVELENVKKVYIPDENEEDGVIIRDYDPSLSISLLENYSDVSRNSHGDVSNSSFVGKQKSDTSWVDLDNSNDRDSSRSSFTSPSTSQTSSSILDKLANQKRPVIIAPPKSMDMKTEKKLVQWMQEQQAEQGCVYLDLFKQYAKSLHTGPKHFAATQAWMTRFKQRNHTALKNVVIKSRFRNEYSMEDKIAIVEEAKRLGCHHVGRKLGINGSVIHSWKTQLDQAEKTSVAPVFIDVLDVGDADSSRGIVPEFESRIVRMVLETQRAKGSVSDEDISLCARSVYKETRPNFKASYNWVADFIRKYEDQLKEVVFENRKKLKTEEEKLKILSEERKYGTEHVIKKRNISASTISTWKKQMREKAIPIPKFKAAISEKIKKKYAKNKIKNYTTEEKRKMVAIAEEHGITYATLKLGISRKVIDKWIRFFRDQGEQIVINARKPSVLKKELEQKVLSWVLEQNAVLGVVLTGRVIEYARKVFEEAYTNFTASTSWLETFLSAQGSKLENVRFRDKGDSDLEFSDEIKLKVARHAEVSSGTVTAELTGLLPKVIYHWRRQLKQKGYDLKADLDSSTENPPGLPVDPSPSTCPEPTSLLQQKLDRIAVKFDITTRRKIVEEASINGTSATATKRKIPLPLLLKWMKTSVNGTESPATVSFKSASSASIQKDSPMSSAEKTFKRHSKETRMEAVAEAKIHGVKLTSERLGIPYSTLYTWVKEDRDSSVDSERDSVEILVTEKHNSIRRSLSHDRSSIGSETPVKVIPPEKIKREPGLPVKTSAILAALTSRPKTVIFSSPKKVRKYTNEEKFAVVRSALKIGAKEAAQLFDIPQSNVKRWKDMYKDKVLRQTNVPAKKTLPAPVSKVKHESVNQGKRKAEDSIEHGKSKRGKYTVEEKMAFVKESDTTNMKAVAEKAGVTLDCLYRWRFQYLASVRLAAATAAGSHSGTPERDKSSSPVMPAPRNMAYMLPEHAGEEHTVHDIDEMDNFEHPENIVARLTEDELAQIESMTESTMKDLDDMTDSSAVKKTNVIESVKSPSEASPPLDDIVISATDRLLEMTSQYESTELQGSPVTDKTSPGGQGDPSSDVAAEPTDQQNDWDKIKIVNVKSEAPIS